MISADEILPLGSMPQKLFEVPDLGSVLVVKRRSTRNLRLSITPKSQIRVSQPPYIPYAVGLKFAIDRRQWILSHLAKRTSLHISDGMAIGKSYRLKVIPSETSTKFMTRFADQEVRLSVPFNASSAKTFEASKKAVEAALTKDSAKLLSIRLNELAEKYGYKYKELKFKKLSSRWGSCSSTKVITLSIYLIQLPWHLIDYVLLHELTHLNHMHHQKAFWDELENNVKNVKALRKEIKKFNPGIISF